MFRISVEAMRAWAETIAAVGSTVAVLLLVWDRVRPKPLQLSGYLVLHKRPRALMVKGYLFSEAGEHLVLIEVEPSPHFEIALVPTQTAASQAHTPVSIEWSRSALPYRARAERGHSGDERLFEIYIRPAPIGGLWDRWLRWLYRPAIRARGLLPYRQKGRFKRGLILPLRDLDVAVNEYHSEIVGAHSDAASA